MKKLILTLMFVFAMGSIVRMEASTNNVLAKSCAEGAFDLQGYLEAHGETKVEANRVASGAYDKCVKGTLVFK